MSFDHAVYGLKVRSNRRIPGLPAAHTTAEPDLTVRFRQTSAAIANQPAAPGEPWYSSPERDENGQPVVRVWREAGNGFRFEYDDGSTVTVNERADQALARSPANLSFEDTAYYVNGPLLGFALRRRGITSLHASAVAFNGGAALFLGDVGAGKSTTAAALSRRGLPVITEDIAALDEIDGRFHVRSGYPRVNLWPESATVLFGSPDALPPIAPPWEKRYLPLSDSEFRSGATAAPIRAVYFLGERRRGGRASITPLGAKEGLLPLVANTYMNYLPDMRQRARDFEQLARLAENVRLRRLSAVDGKLDDLCQAIIGDLG